MRKSFSLNDPNTKIDVMFYFDSTANYARPVGLLWQGARYKLGMVEAWHVTHRKDVLVHHYLVSDQAGERSFRLAFETDNLTWHLTGTRSLTPGQPFLPVNPALAGGAI